MRTNSLVIAGSPPLRYGLIFAVIALIALLAATVVVGALVLREPTVPPAYGPAGNGVLAYAESGDIFTADSTGANVSAITSGPATDSRPVFSRDGTRLAFLRREDGATKVAVANADGTGVHAVSPELYDDVHAIDWSPDGTEMAPTRREHTRSFVHYVSTTAGVSWLRRIFEKSPLGDPKWARHVSKNGSN